jgi:hypothetical protein
MSVRRRERTPTLVAAGAASDTDGDSGGPILFESDIKQQGCLRPATLVSAFASRYSAAAHRHWE